MKIRYGLKNLKYAQAYPDSSGAVTYGTYKDMKGAKSMSLTQVGETVTEYADNIEWFIAALNNGYEGSVVLEEAPESFLVDILGYEKDSNGVLFEDADAQTKEYAHAGEFSNSGDATVTGKRFCFFRCTASRPNTEGQTKENNLVVAHDTINIRAMPRISDGMVKASADSDAAGYASWFNAVVVKSS